MAAQLEQLRAKGAKHVSSDRRDQENSAQLQNARFPQCAAHGQVLHLFTALRIVLHRFSKPRLLIVSEPLRVRRLVRQGPKRDNPEDNRGNAFHKEKPLPAPQAASTIHLQKDVAKRKPNETEYGLKREKSGHNAGANVTGNPVRYVKYD